MVLCTYKYILFVGPGAQSIVGRHSVDGDEWTAIYCNIKGAERKQLTSCRAQTEINQVDSMMSLLHESYGCVRKNSPCSYGMSLFATP